VNDARTEAAHGAFVGIDCSENVAHVAVEMTCLKGQLPLLTGGNSQHGGIGGCSHDVTMGREYAGG
jgi:hypothetical protein